MASHQRACYVLALGAELPDTLLPANQTSTPYGSARASRDLGAPRYSGSAPDNLDGQGLFMPIKPCFLAKTSERLRRWTRKDRNRRTWKLTGNVDSPRAAMHRQRTYRQSRQCNYAKPPSARSIHELGRCLHFNGLGQENACQGLWSRLGLAPSYVCASVSSIWADSPSGTFLFGIASVPPSSGSMCRVPSARWAWLPGCIQMTLLTPRRATDMPPILPTIEKEILDDDYKGRIK